MLGTFTRFFEHFNEFPSKNSIETDEIKVET